MKKILKKGDKLATLLTGTLVGLAFVQVLIAILQMIVILLKLE